MQCLVLTPALVRKGSSSKAAVRFDVALMPRSKEDDAAPRDEPLSLKVFAVRASIVLTPGGIVQCLALAPAKKLQPQSKQMQCKHFSDAWGIVQCLVLTPALVRKRSSSQAAVRFNVGSSARAQAVREVMAEVIISDPRGELHLSLRIYHDVESKAFEGRVPSAMTPIATDCISVRSQ